MSIKDWLKFITLSILWGSVFLVIKTAQRELGPLTLVTLRVWLAVMSFVIIFSLWGRKLPLRSNWKKFLMLGLLNIALPFSLITWSQHHITSGMSSVLNATTSLFTLLLAHWLVPDDRLTLPKVLGLMLGFGGVILLLSGNLHIGPRQTLIGQVAMLTAALFYASGTIYARRAAHDLAPEVIAMGQALFAGLFILPAALFLEAPFRLPRLPLTWAALLWLGLFCTCISHMLFFSLLKSVGPTRTQLVTYGMILFAVALGVIFLGETPDWRFFAGGSLIALGILIVNNPLKRNQNGRKPLHL